MSDEPRVETYTPPDGYEDLPYIYVYDASGLTDGQNALNQQIAIEPGLGVFVLRRVVGFENVLNPSTGQFQMKDNDLSTLEAVPVFVQGGGEFLVSPEIQYNENGAIRFDLYSVLRAT